MVTAVSKTKPSPSQFMPLVVCSPGNTLVRNNTELLFLFSFNTQHCFIPSLAS